MFAWGWHIHAAFDLGIKRHLIEGLALEEHPYSNATEHHTCCQCHMTRSSPKGGELEVCHHHRSNQTGYSANTSNTKTRQEKHLSQQQSYAKKDKNDRKNKKCCHTILG